MTRRPRKSTLFPNPTLFRSRREMPPYLKEYPACPEVFQEAFDALINRRSPLGGGTFGGVGPDGYGLGTDFASPTPREREDLAQAQRGAGSRPVPIADTAVYPGGAGLGAKSVSHPLPTPLLIVLILLGVGLAARSIPAVRRLLPALGPVTNRVFPRRPS